MTRLLFDTSAVIGLLERQDPQLRDLVARSSSEIAVSAITLGELEHGMHTNPSEVRRETLAVATGAMDRVDIDGLFAPSCYGFIRSNTSRRVGPLDCWIASAAVIAGFILVTQDAQLDHGLSGIEWSESPWDAHDAILVPIADTPAPPAP